MWLLTLHYGRIVLRNLRETTVATSFVENQQDSIPVRATNTTRSQKKQASYQTKYIIIRPYKIQSTN